jgi:hypothetical protein
LAVGRSVPAPGVQALGPRLHGQRRQVVLLLADSRHRARGLADHLFATLPARDATSRCGVVPRMMRSPGFLPAHGSSCGTPVNASLYRGAGLGSGVATSWRIRRASSACVRILGKIHKPTSAKTTRVTQPAPVNHAAPPGRHTASQRTGHTTSPCRNVRSIGWPRIVLIIIMPDLRKTETRRPPCATQNLLDTVPHRSTVSNRMHADRRGHAAMASWRWMRRWPIGRPIGQTQHHAHCCAIRFPLHGPGGVPIVWPA